MNIFSAFFWMVICVYHEARGEDMEGKIWVAHTIINRSNFRKLSIEDVIKQPWQYSWYNGDKLKKSSKIEYEPFIDCVKAVNIAIAEQEAGMTRNNVDHYYNPDKVDKPHWATVYNHVKKVGNHRFYTSRPSE